MEALQLQKKMDSAEPGISSCIQSRSSWAIGGNDQGSGGTLCKNTSPELSKNPRITGSAITAISATKRWKKAKNAIAATRRFAHLSGHLADTHAPPLPLHQEDVLIDLFNAFDHAKAQHITIDDFGIILQTFLNRQLDSKELAELIDSADGMTTASGSISFINFKNRMARAVYQFNAHGMYH